MIKTAIFTILGAVAGFLYYKYVGCVSGTCPITSNPWTSIGYGTVVGLVLGWNNPSKEKEVGHENDNP